MVHARQVQNAMQHQNPDLVDARMPKRHGLRLGTIGRNRYLTQAGVGIAGWE
jgi:hypothetical protein